MTPQQLVAKRWHSCRIPRDGGRTYGDHVGQLTAVFRKDEAPDAAPSAAGAR